jgi:hypothetical protein
MMHTVFALIIGVHLSSVVCCYTEPISDGNSAHTCSTGHSVSAASAIVERNKELSRIIDVAVDGAGHGTLRFDDWLNSTFALKKYVKPEWGPIMMGWIQLETNIAWYIASDLKTAYPRVHEELANFQDQMMYGDLIRQQLRWFRHFLENNAKEERFSASKIGLLKTVVEELDDDLESRQGFSSTREAINRASLPWRVSKSYEMHVITSEISGRLRVLHCAIDIAEKLGIPHKKPLKDIEVLPATPQR